MLSHRRPAKAEFFSAQEVIQRGNHRPGVKWLRRLSLVTKRPNLPRPLEQDVKVKATTHGIEITKDTRSSWRLATLLRSTSGRSTTA